MQKLNDVKTALLKAGSKLKACTEKEVQEIEAFYQVKLPPLYVAFLLMMGKGAGHYMEGTSVFFDRIFTLRRGAEALLSENNLDPLPSNAFVFWLHQGYQMAFFLLDDNEELPVYYFDEGQLEKGIVLRCGFVDFLKEELEMSGLI